MPAFCFQAEGIGDLHESLKKSGVIADDIEDHGWFLEFDFYDLGTSSKYGSHCARNTRHIA